MKMQQLADVRRLQAVGDLSELGKVTDMLPFPDSVVVRC